MTSAKLFALGLSFMLSSLFWFPSTSAADAIVRLSCVGDPETCKNVPSRVFYLLPEAGTALSSDIQECAARAGCRPRLTESGAGNLMFATCATAREVKQGLFELPGDTRALGKFTMRCARDRGDLTIENLQLAPEP